jgi:hypothetical protein
MRELRGEEPAGYKRYLAVPLNCISGREQPNGLRQGETGLQLT